MHAHDSTCGQRLVSHLSAQQCVCASADDAAPRKRSRSATWPPAAFCGCTCIPARLTRPAPGSTPFRGSRPTGPGALCGGHRIDAFASKGRGCPDSGAKFHGPGVQNPMTPPPGPFSGTVIALNLYQNPLECAALNEIDDPPPPYGPKETSKLGSFLRIF